MEISNSQAQFFQNLKNFIPDYSSLVDEVSEILNISIDSAYRRIRGEKLLDFQEIELLCKRFNVSVDKFFSAKTNTILFQGKQNTYEKDSFMDWMEDVLAQLNLVNSFSKKHIYYLCKDMPPFYHYYHKELAAFKFFFWMKSILFAEHMNGTKFSISENIFNQYEEVTRKIINTYNKCPTTEIWSEEGINTTLRQIELYHQMGIINNPKDTLFLYNCVIEVVDHLEKMAEAGKKFMLNQSPNEECPEYNFFVNEFVIGDNTFFVELDENKITYLNYGVIYFLGTADQKFNEGMFRNLENLIKKSTQISSVGEKERKQFFNKLRKKIQAKIDLI